MGMFSLMHACFGSIPTYGGVCNAILRFPLNVSYAMTKKLCFIMYIRRRHSDWTKEHDSKSYFSLRVSSKDMGKVYKGDN